MASSNLVQLIKRTAMEAYQASKPCDYFVGTVEEEKPLSIRLSQNLVIDSDFLSIAQSLTDHKVPIKNVSLLGDSTAASYREGECLLIHHLVKGDKVLMLRKKGGQKYVIVDRVVSV